MNEWSCLCIMFDVAITTYRRPEMARAAVASCLSQGDLLRNVVVVDDASCDGTEERIRSLKDSRIIYHQRASNGGIATARRDAFARSDADWTISLDSDHELMPGALQGLSRLLQATPQTVDILGARYRWDSGGISPVNIPAGVVDYQRRIALTCQPQNIGTDYLCGISRRIRRCVQWEPYRSIFPDTLFQLDIARVGDAVFAPDTLALQKSDGAFGWTRGSAMQRWNRRCHDASDAVKSLNLILDRHGVALRQWGRPRLAELYMQGAFAAILSGRRLQATRWITLSLREGGPSVHLLALLICSLLPISAVRSAYRLRGWAIG